MEGDISGDQSSVASDHGSDDESNDSERTGESLSSSSSASSPLPIDSLGSIFEVHGIRSSPESGTLTFRVQRLDDPENKDAWEVTRNYEAFDSFHRLLLVSQKFEGIIYPPLPPPLSSKSHVDVFVEDAFIHRKQVER